MSRPFKISSISTADDINIINKQGLWYYMTGTKSSYDNNIEKIARTQRNIGTERNIEIKENIGLEENIGIEGISERIITYLK
jgi:hypothetical protein